MKSLKKSAVGPAEVWMSSDGENNLAGNVSSARTAMFSLREMTHSNVMRIDLFGLENGFLKDRH